LQDDWKINPNRYRVQQVIGEGSYGSVAVAKDTKMASFLSQGAKFGCFSGCANGGNGAPPTGNASNVPGNVAIKKSKKIFEDLTGEGVLRY
jgi:serine/threonine protein kinase